MEDNIIGGTKQPKPKVKRVKSSVVSIYSPKKRNKSDDAIRYLQQEIYRLEKEQKRLTEKIKEHEKTKKAKTAKATKTKAKAKKAKTHDLFASFSNLTLGTTTTVKAAIWAHGGQGQVTRAFSQIFTPIPNMQLNIFGLAISGECTIGSVDSLNLLDTFMETTNHWPPTPGDFEKIYDAHHDRLSEEMKANHVPKGQSKFEYNKDYGRGDKSQAEKFFTGANKPFENDPLHIAFGISDKPLLRIYEIMHRGKNVLTSMFPEQEVRVNKCKDIYLDSVSTLTDIMNTIGTLCTGALETNQIVVELLDNSCNSTIDRQPPTIGTIVPKKGLNQNPI